MQRTEWRQRERLSAIERIEALAPRIELAVVERAERAIEVGLYEVRVLGVTRSAADDFDVVCEVGVCRQDRGVDAREVERFTRDAGSHTDRSSAER